MNDFVNDLAAYLESLITKLHPGMAKHHEKLNALEYTMRAEYDGLSRHMAHVKALAESLHEGAAAELTDIAKTMGFIPVQTVPPPIQQMQIPEDMPRVARTRAEQTVESIYGQLAN